MFFTPEAQPFKLTGGGNWGQQHAQFISYDLKIDGGAILQMASNLIFTWQAFVGVNLWALTLTIIVENFTGAIGTVIFVAYLSALCNNPLHTATQYALLTALAAVGRTYLSAGAGFIAEWTGWQLFFVISALTALPSLALLIWLQQRGHFVGLIKPTRIIADD